MKSLFEYLDYRAYLGDTVSHRKSIGFPCTNRWFAQKMGINSSSWLTMVIKGKIGLSKTTANKLSEILNHSPLEARFFEILVFFNQSRTINDRNRYYSELCDILKTKDVRVISKDRYDYYSQWYNSVIRSLIGMYGFNGDYAGLAGMVVPPITPVQARKSVNLLESLNFIVKTDGGGYKLTDTAITSGEEIKSLAVANFQRETMKIAMEAMDRFDRKGRYIGTQTLGVSMETFLKIKQLLIDTGNRIAELANTDQNADRVVQINFQAFPMSVSAKDSEARS